MNEARLAQTVDAMLRQGRLAEAEDVVLRAIEHGADLAASQDLLGAVYLEQNQPELAAVAASTAVRLDPTREGAWLRLARAHRRLGRRQEALETLLAAIERGPALPDCYLDAVQVLRELGAVDRALELAEQAGRRFPALRWQTDRMRLELLLWDRRYAAAEEAADALLTTHGDDVAALECLAMARYHLDRSDEAVEAVQRLVTLAPEVAEYQLRLAALLREIGELDRAVVLLQHLVDHADSREERTLAQAELSLIDAQQVPVVLTMASESRAFLRELQADPPTALHRHGFALSRDAMLSLLPLLSGLSGGSRSSVRYH